MPSQTPTVDEQREATDEQEQVIYHCESRAEAESPENTDCHGEQVREYEGRADGEPLATRPGDPQRSHEGNGERNEQLGTQEEERHLGESQRLVRPGEFPEPENDRDEGDEDGDPERRSERQCVFAPMQADHPSDVPMSRYTAAIPSHVVPAKVLGKTAVPANRRTPRPITTAIVRSTFTKPTRCKRREYFVDGPRAGREFEPGSNSPVDSAARHERRAAEPGGRTTHEASRLHVRFPNVSVYKVNVGDLKTNNNIVYRCSIVSIESSEIWLMHTRIRIESIFVWKGNFSTR